MVAIGVKRSDTPEMLLTRHRRRATCPFSSGRLLQNRLVKPFRAYETDNAAEIFRFATSVAIVMTPTDSQMHE
jgi:hypothetical protein